MTPAAEAYAVLSASCGDVALIRTRPDFAITSKGDVYRLSGVCHPDTYPLKITNFPAKAIASLMSEHFPDQPQTKEARS